MLPQACLTIPRLLSAGIALACSCCSRCCCCCGSGGGSAPSWLWECWALGTLLPVLPPRRRSLAMSAGCHSGCVIIRCRACPACPPSAQPVRLAPSTSPACRALQQLPRPACPPSALLQRQARHSQSCPNLSPPAASHLRVSHAPHSSAPITLVASSTGSTHGGSAPNCSRKKQDLRVIRFMTQPSERKRQRNSQCLRICLSLTAV